MTKIEACLSSWASGSLVLKLQELNFYNVKLDQHSSYNPIELVTCEIHVPDDCPVRDMMAIKFMQLIENGIPMPYMKELKPIQKNGYGYKVFRIEFEFN